MGDGLEEEEPVRHVDLDQHHCTGGDGIEKDDDVENADGVQDHVPWTSQRLLELRHHDCRRSVSKSAERREYRVGQRIIDAMKRLEAAGCGIKKDGKEATGQQEALRRKEKEEREQRKSRSTRGRIKKREHRAKRNKEGRRGSAEYLLLHSLIHSERHRGAGILLRQRATMGASYE